MEAGGGELDGLGFAGEIAACEFESDRSAGRGSFGYADGFYGGGEVPVLLVGDGGEFGEGDLGVPVGGGAADAVGVGVPGEVGFVLGGPEVGGGLGLAAAALGVVDGGAFRGGLASEPRGVSPAVSRTAWTISGRGVVKRRAWQWVESQRLKESGWWRLRLVRAKVRMATARARRDCGGSSGAASPA